MVTENQNLHLFDETDYNKWKSEWVGMPEFVQGKQEPYTEIIFRFRCAEDLKAFSDLIGQPLTKRTKSAWYPVLVRGINADKRYTDES